MTRTCSLLVGLTLGALAYACSTSGGGKQGGQAPTTGPGDGTDPGSAGGDGGPASTAAANPIEGIAPPKVALVADAYTDGPAWHAGLGALFFTTPLGDGALYRLSPDGSVLVVRLGSAADGTTPFGNTPLVNGDLITVDEKRVVRTAVASDAAAPAPVVVASGFVGDGGIEGFDGLKSVVARKDGTLYVTDPGYTTTPIANRLYRISTKGEVQVVDVFEDVPRPNGLALAPDEKTLYVDFTQPLKGQMPFIRKYAVNADGTLGPWKSFVEIPPADSTPDGLAVDTAGNVYVATKDGIRVFKSDATVIGTVAVPETPTGIAFGGTDMKSLYVTTEGTRIWELRLNVPGVAR